jgi:hypothetical protein
MSATSPGENRRPLSRDERQLQRYIAALRHQARPRSGNQAKAEAEQPRSTGKNFRGRTLDSEFRDTS